MQQEEIALVLLTSNRLRSYTLPSILQCMEQSCLSPSQGSLAQMVPRWWNPGDSFSWRHGAKHHHLGILKSVIEKHSLLELESRNPKSRYWEGWSLPESEDFHSWPTSAALPPSLSSHGLPNAHVCLLLSLCTHQSLDVGPSLMTSSYLTTSTKAGTGLEPEPTS